MSSAVDHTSIDDASRAPGALLPGLHGPLQHLVAAAELLDRQRLTPEARACARAILQSGRTLLQVVEDLQRLDSLSAEPIAPARYPLSELVEEVEALWRLQTAPSAGRLLISCQASEGVVLEIEGAAIKQLMNALIRRALADDPTSVVEATFAVAASGDQPLLRLSVSQSRRSHGAPGSDSAFAVAQTLVARLGGDLRLIPHLGQGERVEVAVPVRLAAAVDDASDDDIAVLPAQTHVLIVDDNATNRMVAAALCEMFGCTTETAEDGVEAVDAARSTRFDLILMDIRMPRMDGVEATRAIRRLPGALGRVPIVALTANGDSEAARIYMAAGMNAVVEKPIKPDRLLETLQAVLAPQQPDSAAVSAA